MVSRSEKYIGAKYGDETLEAKQGMSRRKFAQEQQSMPENRVRIERLKETNKNV